MNFEGITGHTRQLNYLKILKEKGEIPHAFLFSGPSGIGKRIIAGRFLNSLFCQNSPSPCLDCPVCSQFNAGSFPDYLVLEKDEKGKIPVGDRDKPAQGTVRWLIDRLNKSAVTGRYGILIDGVDTISEAGQNALLKTIEEPPAGTCIIMTARSRATVLGTILSRSMDMTFNPLHRSLISDILISRGFEQDAAKLISSVSGGSVENALLLGDENILDAIFNFCGEINGSLNSNNGGVFFSDAGKGLDNELLLTLAVNIYSVMLSEKYEGTGSILPGSVQVEDTEVIRKIIKILLAIKKGLNNNLNVKNSLKGMFYSFEDISSSGFPEPDLSWLD